MRYASLTCWRGSRSCSLFGVLRPQATADHKWLYRALAGSPDAGLCTRCRRNGYTTEVGRKTAPTTLGGLSAMGPLMPSPARRDPDRIWGHGHGVVILIAGRGRGRCGDGKDTMPGPRPVSPGATWKIRPCMILHDAADGDRPHRPSSLNGPGRGELRCGSAAHRGWGRKWTDRSATLRTTPTRVWKRITCG